MPAWCTYCETSGRPHYFTAVAYNLIFVMLLWQLHVLLCLDFVNIFSFLYFTAVHIITVTAVMIAVPGAGDVR